MHCRRSKKNVAAKKRRLREDFLNVTTDAWNRYISQNKNVKNKIIRKKRKYYQNKLTLESSSRTKIFLTIFKKIERLRKKSESLNLSKEDAELFSEYFPNIGARFAQSKPTCTENNVNLSAAIVLF